MIETINKLVFIVPCLSPVHATTQNLCAHCRDFNQKAHNVVIMSKPMVMQLLKWAFNTNITCPSKDAKIFASKSCSYMDQTSMRIEATIDVQFIFCILLYILQAEDYGIDG